MSQRPDPKPVKWSADAAAVPALSRLLSRAAAATEKPPAFARERIWRALEAQGKPPSPSRWALVAAPALGLLCALGVVVLLSPAADPAAVSESAAPVATAALATRNAWVERPGQGGRALTPGEKLGPRATLSTGVGSRAGLRLGGSGALLGESARATLLPEGAVADAWLSSGPLAVAAAREVRVLAEGLVVESSSAVFEVNVAADRTVSVRVHDESVTVRGPLVQVTVRAGESWSSAPGAGSTLMSEDTAAIARWLRQAPGDPAAVRVEGPPGSQVEVDGVVLGPAPLKLFVPRGPHAFAALRDGRRAEVLAQVGQGADVVQLADPLDAGQALDAQVASLQARLEGQLSAAEREALTYELARLLAGRGRAAEAVALFEGVARGDGLHAEASLYEVGRLRLRNLADPHGALAAFAGYRQRFAAGALEQEVALSSLEAHLALGEQTVALGELDRFLAAYPDSERRDDLRLLRANLRRERGDCAAALVDYRALEADATRSDDALFFAAGCERKQGDVASARRHLGEYLQRFPAGAHRAEAARALTGP